MEDVMRVNGTALAALLVGVVAGTAFTADARAQSYGGPPGAQGQYDAHWRQPTRPDYGYDRDQTPGGDVGFFYDELSPYGEWVWHPQYRWVWFPRHARANWRPYSLGRWVESDYGWTWASDEPFGWATYHYGRWAWEPEVGWLWVPGTDWGPAWVAWQHGNGYIGWAPLPPQVGFEMGVGIRLGGFSLSVGIAPRDYAFVEERRFLHSNIGGYIMPQARNITIIHNTTNITNYTFVNNRIINNGVPIERIEQVTGTRAPRLRVATATDPRRASVQRNVINIYRPTASKLETVKVGQRNNAGVQQGAPMPSRTEVQPPDVRRPEAAPIRQETAPVPIPVAPRTRPVLRDASESQYQREQKDLKAAQDKQQKTLDKIHRQELAQAQAKKADAQEVAQRHTAELQAQQEQRQVAAQQLQTRQQIERQAARVSATHTQNSPKPQAAPPAVKAGADKAKGKDKPKDEKKNDQQQPPRTF
jgi:hypothetical protein